MSAFLRHADNDYLLPNEPRVADKPEQHAKTEQYLLPASAAIFRLFQELRVLVDPFLSNRQPIKNGRPYPYGQCLELSLAVLEVLHKVPPERLSPRARKGRDAINQFCANDGTLRQVWGDLRGEYFQNAILLGTLYIDVANDSVHANKPKVEIQSFEASNLIPIKDYEHFKQRVESYWEDRVWPNVLFPELAPFCPLIRLTRSGRLLLSEVNDYMLGMTRDAQFKPSQEVLAQSSMPEEAFKYLKRNLDQQPGLPKTLEKGKAGAISKCREYRQRKWFKSDLQQKRILQQVTQANQMLSELDVDPLLSLADFN